MRCSPRFGPAPAACRLGATLALCLALWASTARAEVRRFEVDGHPVVVLLPSASQGPWPVLYLMGGMGELSRGERVSAGAWVDDYGIQRVVTALEAGRVTAATLQGLGTARELAAVRRRLREGYRGLVLVGLPAPVDYTEAFESFVLHTVFPWAERTLPIRPGAAYRGIDGVSLGGRHALRLGLRHPTQFRSVGAVQGAVRGHEAAIVDWARLAVRACGGRPPPCLNAVKGAQGLALNLASSDGDPYRHAIRRLATQLSATGLSTRHVQLSGPHDYIFNRGPGAVDLLLFHDAVLNVSSSPVP